ncbi:MAG: hypothetical protein A2Z42_03570 [Candidatus Woykebacteria bacterium RBG_19FT_COMBO_43_10]|uniref:Uncharacterized protein n=1 Tax=Candidatus Woykebacteria bacterium RBG_19FT_COMBO_43_10 TaxID=1802598 RepID=A0A1G1WHW4_9BACT|nr:MAG: hypothetical protein A2Z42_03570 [Candidatus Woykebacteria bacterium RBG_19FT_COMBO_43_10]
MGLFGATETKENLPTGGKICPNCGKEIPTGTGLKREDGHFCCVQCCERGPKQEKEKSKTCEFC